MTAADAAYKVLVEAGRPLHYKEITDRILTAGLWTTAGKTPWDTVAARVTGDIRLHGMKSRFVKTEPGVFAARTTGDLFADMASTTTARSTPSKASDTPSEPSRPVPKPSNGQMSFLDAAEHVLRGLKPGTRMHYRDITNRALEAELIRTRGKTPDATMAAQIGTDIRRRDEREEPQRFVSRRGIIGLAEELPVGIAEQIRKHNVKARAKLLKRAREGSFVHRRACREAAGRDGFRGCREDVFWSRRRHRRSWNLGCRRRGAHEHGCSSEALEGECDCARRSAGAGKLGCARTRSHHHDERLQHGGS